MSRELSTLDFEILFYERLVREKPDFVDALIPLAEAYTKKKLYGKGLAVDERLAGLCKDDPTVHYNLACSLALVGRKKEAVGALRKALRLGYDDRAHLMSDSDLKSLHGEPEFQALVNAKKETFPKER